MLLVVVESLRELSSRNWHQCQSTVTHLRYWNKYHQPLCDTWDRSRRLLTTECTCWLKNLFSVQHFLAQELSSILRESPGSGWPLSCLRVHRAVTTIHRHTDGYLCTIIAKLTALCPLPTPTHHTCAFAVQNTVLVWKQLGHIPGVWDATDWTGSFQFVYARFRTE